MIKMVKEIAGLCYELDKLYIHEKDKKKKQEIGKNFDIMSGLLDKAIRSQFDENDTVYKRSVRKLRKYSKMIREKTEQLERFERYFSGLSNLGEQLDELLAGSK